MNTTMNTTTTTSTTSTSTTVVDYWPVMSPSQFFLMQFIISMTSNTLSLIASFAVVISSYRRIMTPQAESRYSNGSSVYQIFIFMISSCDLASAFCDNLHWFMLPRYARQYDLFTASGNQGTCSLAGYTLLFWPIIVAYFNCFLSLYFYSKAKYNILDRTIKQKYIIPGTIVAFIIALSLTTFGLFYDGYKLRPFWNFCHYGTCVVGVDDITTTNCAIKGTALVFQSLYFVVIMIPSMTSCFATIGLYLVVRQTLQKNMKYQIIRQPPPSPNDAIVREPSNHNFTSTLSLANNKNNNNNHDNKNMTRLLQVRNQGIMFALVYLNCSCLFAARIIFPNQIKEDAVVSVGVIIYTILLYMLWPLQGFLNFFVYTYPRYNEFRKKYPTGNKYRALYLSLTLEPASDCMKYFHDRDRYHNNRSSTRFSVGSSKQFSGGSRWSFFRKNVEEDHDDENHHDDHNATDQFAQGKMTTTDVTDKETRRSCTTDPKLSSTTSTNDMIDDVTWNSNNNNIIIMSHDDDDDDDDPASEDHHDQQQRYDERRSSNSIPPNIMMDPIYEDHHEEAKSEQDDDDDDDEMMEEEIVFVSDDR